MSKISGRGRSLGEAGCQAGWALWVPRKLASLQGTPSPPSRQCAGLQGRAGSGHSRMATAPRAPRAPRASTRSPPEGSPGPGSAASSLRAGHEPSTRGLPRKQPPPPRQTSETDKGRVHPLTSLPPRPPRTPPWAWTPSVAVLTQEGWREWWERGPGAQGARKKERAQRIGRAGCEGSACRLTHILPSASCQGRRHRAHLPDQETEAQRPWLTQDPTASLTLTLRSSLLPGRKQEQRRSGGQG